MDLMPIVLICLIATSVAQEFITSNYVAIQQTHYMPKLSCNAWKLAGRPDLIPTLPKFNGSEVDVTCNDTGENFRFSPQKEQDDLWIEYIPEKSQSRITVTINNQKDLTIIAMKYSGRPNTIMNCDPTTYTITCDKLGDIGGIELWLRNEQTKHVIKLDNDSTIPIKHLAWMSPGAFLENPEISLVDMELNTNLANWKNPDCDMRNETVIEIIRPLINLLPYQVRQQLPDETSPQYINISVIEIENMTLHNIMLAEKFENMLHSIGNFTNQTEIDNLVSEMVTNQNNPQLQSCLATGGTGFAILPIPVPIVMKNPLEYLKTFLQTSGLFSCVIKALAASGREKRAGDVCEAAGSGMKTLKRAAKKNNVLEKLKKAKRVSDRNALKKQLRSELQSEITSELGESLTGSKVNILTSTTGSIGLSTLSKIMAGGSIAGIGAGSGIGAGLIQAATDPSAFLVNAMTAKLTTPGTVVMQKETNIFGTVTVPTPTPVEWPIPFGGEILSDTVVATPPTQMTEFLDMGTLMMKSEAVGLIDFGIDLPMFERTLPLPVETQGLLQGMYVVTDVNKIPGMNMVPDDCYWIPLYVSTEEIATSSKIKVIRKRGMETVFECSDKLWMITHTLESSMGELYQMIDDEPIKVRALATQIPDQNKLGYLFSKTSNFPIIVQGPDNRLSSIVREKEHAIALTEIENVVNDIFPLANMEGESLWEVTSQLTSEISERLASLGHSFKSFDIGFRTMGQDYDLGIQAPMFVLGVDCYVIDVMTTVSTGAPLRVVKAKDFLQTQIETQKMGIMRFGVNLGGQLFMPPSSSFVNKLIKPGKLYRFDGRSPSILPYTLTGQVNHQWRVDPKSFPEDQTFVYLARPSGTAWVLDNVIRHSVDETTGTVWMYEFEDQPLFYTDAVKSGYDNGINTLAAHAETLLKDVPHVKEVINEFLVLGRAHMITVDMLISQVKGKFRWTPTQETKVRDLITQIYAVITLMCDMVNQQEVLAYFYPKDAITKIWQLHYNKHTQVWTVVSEVIPPPSESGISKRAAEIPQVPPVPDITKYLYHIGMYYAPEIPATLIKKQPKPKLEYSCNRKFTNSDGFWLKFVSRYHLGSWGSNFVDAFSKLLVSSEMVWSEPAMNVKRKNLRGREQLKDICHYTDESAVRFVEFWSPEQIFMNTIIANSTTIPLIQLRDMSLVSPMNPTPEQDILKLTCPCAGVIGSKYKWTNVTTPGNPIDMGEGNTPDLVAQQIYPYYIGHYKCNLCDPLKIFQEHSIQSYGITHWSSVICRPDHCEIPISQHVGDIINRIEVDGISRNFKILSGNYIKVPKGQIYVIFTPKTVVKFRIVNRLAFNTLSLTPKTPFPKDPMQNHHPELLSPDGTNASLLNQSTKKYASIAVIIPLIIGIAIFIALYYRGCKKQKFQNVVVTTSETELDELNAPLSLM